MVAGRTIKFPSQGNNYPLRGGKGELFEGGHRVPAIYHTAKLSQDVRGTKRNFLMHITDWLPTFAAMANPRYRLSMIIYWNANLNVANVVCLDNFYLYCFSLFKYVRDRC